MDPRSYGFLSAEEIEQIHNASMRLLQEVGVEFPHEEVIALFRQMGVRTEGQRVYLEEERVLQALETVPSRFTIHARNPERSVTVGDGRPVFAPAYGAPFLVDLEEGKRQPSMADYHDLARLAHALPNQDLSGHLLVEPSDVPAEDGHLLMLQAHIVHSDKPFIGSAEGAEAARHTMEMAEILFGAELEERPVTVALINSLSPLGYSTEMLDALLAYVRHRQPVIIAALAMAGSTGPITLAGVLAMQNAELLAGVTLTQLLSPGTPVVYGSTSTNIDMRTGALAIGSPELSKMVVAAVQLARRYGLPCRSGGSLTDANGPDAQAGLESMLSMINTVNSGVDFVLHAAGILSSYLAFSHEKFVIDDEICGAVRAFREGIEVTPETIAYDVIARVGPGGNYLMEAQTLKRCRSEFWMPALSSREGLEAWMSNDRPTLAQRARARWQGLLAEHEDPPLEESVARQLQAYVEERTS